MEDVAALQDRGRLRISSVTDPDLIVDVERNGRTLRVSLTGQGQSDVVAAYAELERNARDKDHAMLRALTRNAPQLIWKEDRNGHVLWGNRTYLSYSDQMVSDTDTSNTVWPAHRMFPNLAVPEEDGLGARQSRQSLQLKDQEAEHWFDVTTIPDEDGVIHYAADANAAVRAERSQKSFLQTIGQTFAQLSVGLVIFDKQRQLTTFNPAFLDMMNLPFSYLSSRPSLDGVLDRLRDARMLPEPKDYSSWKEQFVALEHAAQSGTYIETWNLPDGQTLRVTGRPHPDGAIAFLFEDISAEISLTRRFRFEIETGQTVLDSFTDAIAVFSASNTLVMMNEAYAELWGDDASDINGNIDLRSALRLWKAGSAPTGVWQSIEVFATTRGERVKWSDSIVLNDGRTLNCYAEPLSGGMTMVRFVATTTPSRTIRKLTQVDPALYTAKR